MRETGGGGDQHRSRLVLRADAALLLPTWEFNLPRSTDLVHPHPVRWVWVLSMLCLAGATPVVAASEDKSDARVRAVLFDEQHAEESAGDVHRRALKMPVEPRFDYLRGWVLPSEDHLAFRLQVDFTPLHPALPDGSALARSGRTASGGEIISPALDLIAAAKSLNKLNRLREQAASAAARSIEDQIAQFAMLALIDMAEGDVETAAGRLDAMLALAPADVDPPQALRGPLLLCVHEAARRAKTSAAVVGPAYRITMSYREVRDPEAWHRQFSAAYARAEQTAASGVGPASAPQPASASPSTPWRAAVRPLARLRGAGAPRPEWKIESGKADRFVGHDEDFLYFPLPLRGNYDVECDLTGFNWRECQLLVAGKWVGPVYDHQSYDLGDIRGVEKRIKFAPPLSKTNDTIHYRTTVRAGVATTWFNGRKIHEEPLPAEHEPWLAIRSPSRNRSGVRNLRITGEPHIPEVLRLSDSPELAGWIPYFGDSIPRGMQDWSHSIGPDGRGEICGARRPEVPPGRYLESLLAYHRPMFEDGAMEYEFWHEPGRFAAHPALDRLCFLLEGDGVKLHWLTDGKYDRTGLPPDNAFDEPENCRGAGSLPLNSNAWNRVRLSVAADTASLELNGRLVYQRRLESTNQRTFGLFHFADQSELRVRDVTWKGRWATALPAREAQVLAVDETGFLDQRLPELSDAFFHDFVADGLPLNRFSLIKGDLQNHVLHEAQGLRVQRPAVEGYRNVTIAPGLTVSGDFDVTAEFEQLVTDAREPDTASTIMLLALAGNPTADECSVIRQRSLFRGNNREVVQCVRVTELKGQPRRQYFALQPMEAASGKLRLARRGDRVYYLFAENDSQQFRLLGEESFPRDDLALEGLRLVAQINGASGSVSVVWKNLSLRAEKLSGPAAQNGDSLLTRLNRERNALAKSFTHDFTRQKPDDALLNRWTDLRAWSARDGGLLIVAPGTDHWSSAGAALKKSMEGDFDISVAFDPQRLDTPAKGLGSSVYLQLELADKDDTQVSLVLNKTSEGDTEAVAQLRMPDGKGDYEYRPVGRASVRSASELRLARRGGELYCLVSSEGSPGAKVLARVEVGRGPVKSGGTRLLVHAGGAGRESRVLWKSIAVKAEAIEPLAAAPAVVAPRSASPKTTPPRPAPSRQAAPKPPSKSMLRSIFDFFSP